MYPYSFFACSEVTLFAFGVNGERSESRNLWTAFLSGASHHIYSSMQLLSTLVALIAVAFAAEQDLGLEEERLNHNTHEQNELGLNELPAEIEIDHAQAFYDYRETNTNISKRDSEPTLLEDFVPVASTIVQGASQRYVFPVNFTDGIGEAYELLVFLTGTICAQPDGGNELQVSFGFNELYLGDGDSFKNGYFQGLAEVPAVNNDNLALYKNVYMEVRAPEHINRTAQWEYQVGVSQQDLVFQWSSQLFATVVDTDDTSALVVTGNLTEPEEGQDALDSGYQLFVYEHGADNAHLSGLNNSWCAVRSGPALFSTANFSVSYTRRGGTLREQFYVKGLNASTRYTAYVVLDFKDSSLGGVVYRLFEIETMTSGACSLVHSLDFCSEVAYSVPALSHAQYRSNSELGALYDYHAQQLYSNFSKAMEQIACNTSAEAIYLPVRTCDDCRDSYKYWLCAVTIPRCLTRDLNYFVRREPGESRSDFINDVIAPNLTYYEVMPCIDICWSMVRDCPADLGLLCPKHNALVVKSYFWDVGANYSTCNFVGVQALVEGRAAAISVGFWMLLGAFASVMMVV